MDQITLFDYLDEKKAEYEKRYPIPRDYQKEEGWHDDWHYTDLELPTESKVYYTIHLTKEGNYFYTYKAYAYGRWWWWDTYGGEWKAIHSPRQDWMIPFAWVDIPDLYLRTDSSLQIRLETLISKEDYEHELWRERRAERWA
jgi:hypothetical protein